MSELFGQVAPKTLRNEVTDLLRAAIVTGKLRPGEHLKEIDIARQMNVSRSPIREAFRLLEQDGLIVSIPNQGCFVKEFSPQEIREIYILRATLENLAYEIILRENRLTQESWDRLSKFLKDQTRAIEAQAYDELAHLDMDFHEYLCSLSGLGRLVEMWRSLRGQILILFFQRFLYLDWVPRTVIEHHTAIVNALHEGDVTQLIRLNSEITERVARECIDLLNGAPGSSTD